MKLFKIVRNCIFSLIIFSKSFPIVFNRTIGHKALGESYNTLLDLGIIMVVNVLKWDGQCSKLMHVLEISISLIIHLLFLMILLIWLQDSLSRLEAKELLYFLIVLISFSLENSVHILIFLLGISSSSWELTLWNCAELNELWKASHRLFNLM